MRPTALFWSLLLFVAACDGGGDAGRSLTLDSVREEGKSDGIHGQRLWFEVSRDVLLEGTGYTGTSNVLFAGEKNVHVRSEGIIVAPPVRGSLHLTVSSIHSDLDGFIRGLTGIETRLRFILEVREKGASEWKTVRSKRGSDEIRAAYFKSIYLNPEFNLITMASDSDSELPIDPDNISPLGTLFGKDLEYRVFIFPVRTWGDLEGSYNYRLHAWCNDGEC